jgi:hypothetical protein
MDEAWRELQAGDRVRIMRMPWDASAPGYFFAPETRRLYKKLIARNRPVRVYEVDEYGLPWIACRFRRRNGTWEYHLLAINDDSWVRVKRRTRPAP